MSNHLNGPIVLVAQLEEQLLEVSYLKECDEMMLAYEKALKAAETSERLTLLTRVLPGYTGCRKARWKIEQMIEQTIKVEIGFTEYGWFSVADSGLDAKERTLVQHLMCAPFFFRAMQRFFQNKEPVRYSDGVLAYRHVYARSRPERQYRDHDNIEVNMVSDIVALFVLKDDAPSFCSHYYCSAAGDADRTEVYVIPKDSFPAWLICEKTMPDAGVILYEKVLDKHQKRYVKMEGLSV